MKNVIKTAIAILMVGIMASCSEEERSVGATSEVLIVVQDLKQWEGTIGDTLRSYFMANQYGLPQPEPHFRLAHTTVDHFGGMLRKHKCILEVEINPGLKEPKAITFEDAWASPQRYVKISAPDIRSWVNLFDSQKEVYRKWYDKVERDRIIAIFRPNNDDDISNAIAKKFGFTLTIPDGYYIAKNVTDFMWIRRELERSSSDIVIYQTDFRDSLQLDEKSLVSMRDLMMGMHIPGPSEGSFVGTELEYEPPMVTPASFYPAGNAVEMRGRWIVHNNYMGGPFVSYTFVDERRGKLVTVEGFYYEPNKDKRNALLQLEAIAYSLKFVDTK